MLCLVSCLGSAGIHYRPKLAPGTTFGIMLQEWGKNFCASPPICRPKAMEQSGNAGFFASGVRRPTCHSSCWKTKVTGTQMMRNESRSLSCIWILACAGSISNSSSWTREQQRVLTTKEGDSCSGQDEWRVGLLHFGHRGSFLAPHEGRYLDAVSWLDIRKFAPLGPGILDHHLPPAYTSVSAECVFSVIILPAQRHPIGMRSQRLPQLLGLRCDGGTLGTLV